MEIDFEIALLQRKSEPSTIGPAVLIGSSAASSLCGSRGVIRYNTRVLRYRFKDMKGAKLICLFPPLSNIACIITEQLFCLACVSLYLRLRALHGDIKTLVQKAERPRWKCWVTPRAGGPSRLGLPAFSASDIHELRVVHRSSMDLFARVNRLFQLPLLLCMFDCVFRIVVYAYGIAFDVTTVMWQKKEHIDYTNAGLWTGYCIIRIVRLWYLHQCEFYVNKKVIIYLYIYI